MDFGQNKFVKLIHLIAGVFLAPNSKLLPRPLLINYAAEAGKCTHKCNWEGPKGKFWGA